MTPNLLKRKHPGDALEQASQPEHGPLPSLPAPLPALTRESDGNQYVPVQTLDSEWDYGRLMANYSLVPADMDLPPGFVLSSVNQEQLAGDASMGEEQGGGFGDQHVGAQGWLDLQDLVVGLDFMGDYDPNFGLPDHQAMGDGDQNTAQQQAMRPDRTSNPRVIRLRYYRRFGPTAVVPGLRRLSVMVENRQQEGVPPSEEEAPEWESAASLVDTASPSSALSHESRIFDKASRIPHPDMVPQILETFFQHFGGHFPFLNPEILGGHVRSGEASSFLLNAIAALTIRFCSFEGPLAHLQEKYEHPWQRGTPFLKKAKEQLVPLLNIPAPEVVAGLLILAWAEFGDNNETGEENSLSC